MDLYCSKKIGGLQELLWQGVDATGNLRARARARARWLFELL
jgi:hypothetical protein